MKQDDDRGNLVGAFIVVEGDEVLAIKQSGQVTRSAIDENLRPTGRDTKGVRFVGVSEGDGVAVVARSVERAPRSTRRSTRPRRGRRDGRAPTPDEAWPSEIVSPRMRQSTLRTTRRRSRPDTAETDADNEES